MGVSDFVGATGFVGHLFGAAATGLAGEGFEERKQLSTFGIVRGDNRPGCPLVQ